MVKVQFNDADEFMAELTTMVEAKVVRVCVLKKWAQLLPICSLAVVAGAINQGGQLVELSVNCGEMVPGRDDPKRANELAEDVRRRARELGFDVRAGRFLAAEAAAC